MYVIQYDFKQNVEFLSHLKMYIFKKTISQKLAKLRVQNNENKCQNIDGPLIVLPVVVWFCTLYIQR